MRLALALLACLLLSTCLSAAALDKSKELKACLDAEFKFKKTSWNHSIDTDSPANLKVEAVWSSRRPPRFDMTVVTQLSVDRMPALFNQCWTFTGPMAAAVYLPLVELEAGPRARHRALAAAGAEQQQTATAAAAAAGGGGPGQGLGLGSANRERVAQEVARITRMYNEMDAAEGSCQLDLMFMWEAFDSQEAALLYPVNSLRNYARMQVKTSLMSAIDVDMMISTSLAQLLMQPQVLEQMQQQALQRQAIVLPAFEPHRAGPFGRLLADEAAQASKVELEQLFKVKKLLQFKKKVFPRGHTPTNYTRWFAATQPYHVPYQRMFEPWYIGHTSLVPFHDVRFRGYGLNKIAHVASLNYYNYSFWIHPGAWLVHRPHEDTAVRKKVAREASDVNKLGVKLPKSALYNKVTLLFGSVKRGMIRGTLQVSLDPAMAACYERLPWLPRLPALQGHPVDPAIFI